MSSIVPPPWVLECKNSPLYQGLLALDWSIAGRTKWLQEMREEEANPPPDDHEYKPRVIGPSPPDLAGQQPRVAGRLKYKFIPPK